MRTSFPLIASLVISGASSFVVVVPTTQRHSTALGATRRDVFTAAGVAVAGLLAVSNGEPSAAFQAPRYNEDIAEPSQMPTDGKLDLNGSFVGEYKKLPGMFPHAAGQIASHGPYKTVKDIYKIPTLTENDVKLFKKYESEFTVNPPGRMFTERINNRVST